MAVEGRQLELEGMPKRARKKNVKQEEEKRGRWGILILLLVTTLISLGLYVKNRLGSLGKMEVRFSLPQLPVIGTQRITIEK